MALAILSLVGTLIAAIAPGLLSLLAEQKKKETAQLQVQAANAMNQASVATNRLNDIKKSDQAYEENKAAAYSAIDAVPDKLRGAYIS